MGAWKGRGFGERGATPKARRPFCVSPPQRALDVSPAITRLRREWQDTMLAGLAPDTRAQLQDALRDAALRAVAENEEEEPQHDQ